MVGILWLWYIFRQGTKPTIKIYLPCQYEQKKIFNAISNYCNNNFIVCLNTCLSKHTFLTKKETVFLYYVKMNLIFFIDFLEGNQLKTSKTGVSNYLGLRAS